MIERLFMAAHLSTRLVISHGVRAASRLDGTDIGMYRGVAFFAKEKLIDLNGTDTSTMVYDFGSIDDDERSRPVQSFFLRFDGWLGLYDR